MKPAAITTALLLAWMAAFVLPDLTEPLWFEHEDPVAGVRANNPLDEAAAGREGLVPVLLTGTILALTGPVDWVHRLVPLAAILGSALVAHRALQQAGASRSTHALALTALLTTTAVGVYWRRDGVEPWLLLATMLMLHRSARSSGFIGGFLGILGPLGVGTAVADGLVRKTADARHLIAGSLGGLLIHVAVGGQWHWEAPSILGLASTGWGMLQMVALPAALAAWILRHREHRSGPVAVVVVATILHIALDPGAFARFDYAWLPLAALTPWAVLTVHTSSPARATARGRRPATATVGVLALVLLSATLAAAWPAHNLRAEEQDAFDAVASLDGQPPLFVTGFSDKAHWYLDGEATFVTLDALEANCNGHALWKGVPNPEGLAQRLAAAGMVQVTVFGDDHPIHFWSCNQANMPSASAS